MVGFQFVFGRYLRFVGPVLKLSYRQNYIKKYKIFNISVEKNNYLALRNSCRHICIFYFKS